MPGIQPDSSNMQINKTKVSGVYVLLLNDPGDDGRPCYYVGKSDDMESRIEQHRSGRSAAAWVRARGGVASVEVPVVPREQLESWEMKETSARMIMHGINNVRGSEFVSTAPLTKEERTSVRTIAMGMGDLCRECGEPGHFARGCRREKAEWLRACDAEDDRGASNAIARAVNQSNKRARGKGCERCGRANHTASSCYAKTDVDGDIIESDTDGCDQSSEDDDFCERCGRYGHTVDRCYARKGVDGKRIT